jgi:hypothetical protein
MSSASIVAVLTGRPDSLEAVRWAAWLSQQTGLPLDVVHAVAGGPGVRQDEALAGERARQWLETALGSCAWSPCQLRLTVTAGPLIDLVDAQLGEAGILVSGSHGPAELVSWACRKRRSPVVLVPDASATGSGIGEALVHEGEPHTEASVAQEPG